MSATERLQKVLAAAGIASRRASEDLIRQGRVTVNGEVAHLGQKVDPKNDRVEVDGERVNVDETRHYVMLNKPTGVVSTVEDPDGRPTVMDLVNVPVRLFPVGRLDQDSEGLLLLTNDGELAHALMHPSYEVERTYVALVDGPVPNAAIDRLRAGVELDDGPARPRRVRRLGEEGDRALLEIVVAEGRNREVRRLVGAVGLRLRRLARVAYGGVELGELRQGKWRPLTTREIATLHRAVAEGPHRLTDKSAKRSRDKSTKRYSQGRPVGSPTRASRAGRDERARRQRSEHEDRRRGAGESPLARDDAGSDGRDGPRPRAGRPSTKGPGPSGTRGGT
ncbi:MAG: pseudouridine synthase [Nitriliruptorales bacterium]|nr:pseudouridine synthase [Nitriliruptorales bacterium]